MSRSRVAAIIARCHEDVGICLHKLRVCATALMMPETGVPSPMTCLKRVIILGSFAIAFSSANRVRWCCRFLQALVGCPVAVCVCHVILLDMVAPGFSRGCGLAGYSVIFV